MLEHAIPQDVTGYRFHIIGNMTLKQFVELGIGCVIGLLIYSTNLPMIIKWPLITVVVALGAMAAFVPIEERPFDHWIVTFFKTLYKPTKFFWRRESRLPEPFLYNPQLNASLLEVEIDLKPARRQRIKEYLTSIQVSGAATGYDVNEQARMSAVLNLFDEVAISSPAEVTAMNERPDLKVRVRSFRPQTTEYETVAPEETPVEWTATPPQISEIPTLELPIEPYQTNQPQLNAAELTTNQVGQQINIPIAESIAISNQVMAAAEAPTIATAPASHAYMDTQNTTPVYAPSQEVIQNLNLPFPAPPTEPNKIVGMVLNQTNELLNETIVEITTESGQVARAVKSNALGQFYITTPLPNGTYTVLAEKDGFTFTPVSLTLTGQLVAPLEIRSSDFASTQPTEMTSSPIPNTAPMASLT